MIRVAVLLHRCLVADLTQQECLTSLSIAGLLELAGLLCILAIPLADVARCIAGTEAGHGDAIDVFLQLLTEVQLALDSADVGGSVAAVRDAGR